MDVLSWWELIVKPGVKKLLIERGKEMNKSGREELNLLLLRQAYLIRKIHQKHFNKLGELKLVQLQIQSWYIKASEKIKLHENTHIFHHEIHKKHLKKSSILQLETNSGILRGHQACAAFLEKSVSDLLEVPPQTDTASQDLLLCRVSPVFTEVDNVKLCAIPSEQEVKESVNSSNLHAAPGTDGLTMYLYKQCWGVLGSALTDVVQTIHGGHDPTLSQRTSMMVFGNKPKKATSLKPNDNRRIALLNADFKVLTGIDSNRLKSMSTHTLSPAQLAAGDNRRIHQGINLARDAINAANKMKTGSGILDNDFRAAFDYMSLLWSLRVLKAKGADQKFIERLKNIYSNNITIIVVNNIPGKSCKNRRWSVRQGDRPSSILFCYGIDPHLLDLQAQLLGIPVYSMPVLGPADKGEQFPLSPLVERYITIGYIDDIKPAVTCMNEFAIIDNSSALFEASSGCQLHRDPASGKVKLLPLGRWK